VGGVDAARSLDGPFIDPEAEDGSGVDEDEEGGDFDHFAELKEG
jgi:hypothetical protein